MKACITAELLYFVWEKGIEANCTKVWHVCWFY